VPQVRAWADLAAAFQSVSGQRLSESLILRLSFLLSSFITALPKRPSHCPLLFLFLFSYNLYTLRPSLFFFFFLALYIS
jgi:hypothetical protein